MTTAANKSGHSSAASSTTGNQDCSENARVDVSNEQVALRMCRRTIRLTVLVLLATLPVLPYSGDNVASRAESIHLLNTGQLGIPYTEAAAVSGLADTRGQYFFFNNTQQRMHSKYGIAYTAIWCVPLAVERCFHPNLSLAHHTTSLTLILGVFSVVTSVVMLHYLWRLCTLGTQSVGICVLGLLAIFFSSPLWFYCRTHAHDVFQLAALACYAWHGSRLALRPLSSASRSDRAHRDLGLCLVAVCCLTHMRFSYLLLVVPVTVIAFVRYMTPSGSALRPATSRVSLSGLQLVMYRVVLPVMLIAGSLLVVQWVRFGHPLEHGYSQWPTRAQQSFAAVSHWKPDRLLSTAEMYLARPGNANIILHMPVLGIALLAGWPLFRKNPLLCVFSCVSGVMIYLPVSNWSTEGHGYGPRYLLGLLVLFAPAITYGLSVIRSLPKLPGRVIAGSLGLIVFGSCWLQYQMIRLPYFAAFDAEYVMTTVPQADTVRQKVSAYFDRSHHGLIHQHLIAHRRGRMVFPPVADVLAAASPDRREGLRIYFDKQLSPLTTNNQLWKVIASRWSNHRVRSRLVGVRTTSLEVQ